MKPFELKFTKTIMEDIGESMAESLLRDDDTFCSICSNVLVENENKIETRCNHSFHRACLQQWLGENSTCPICRRDCSMADLRPASNLPRTPAVPSSNLPTLSPFNAQNGQNLNAQNRPATRQFVKKQAHQSQQQGVRPNQNARRGNRSNRMPSPNRTPAINPSFPNARFQQELVNSNRNRSQQNINQNRAANNHSNLPLSQDFAFPNNPNLPPLPQRPNIPASNNNSLTDMHIRDIISNSLNAFREEQNQFMENLLSRLMGSMRMQDRFDQVGQQPLEEPRLPSRHHTPYLDEEPEYLPSGFRPVTRNPNRRGRQLFDPRVSEKYANMIRNWPIKFSGEKTDIPIDKFISRVEKMIDLHLDGDFDLLCRHIHLLFTGRALDWLFRYHDQEGFLEWYSLCEALRHEYKDLATDFEIKKSIMSRKQREKESFDDFAEAITKESQRLRTRINESELIDIISHNLRPELRHELLHIPIRSLTDLRREARKHENFCQEIASGSRSRYPNRYVSEITVEKHEVACGEDSEAQINEIKTRPKDVWLCHNCLESGHGYRDCKKPRDTHCYSCGAKGQYMSTCQNAGCTGRPGNYLLDARPKKEEHPANTSPREHQ